MFECPNCAKNLKFDIASQQMKCDACESMFDPYAIQKDKDAESSEYFETNIFTCPQCGGQIISEDSEIATFCLFCGSATILTEHLSQERRPDYIIPFQKTKEDCKTAYKKMMKKAFFVPKEFKDEKFIDGFKGVYIPYWTYNFHVKEKMCLKGTLTKHERDRVLTEKYNIFADVDAEFNGDYYDASASFYDEISYALAPYDLGKSQKFTTGFLSGYYANCAEVDEFIYLSDSEELAKKEISQKITQDNAFSRYKLYDKDKIEINFDSRAEKVLFPVWLMSYRNKDRVAYAAVNGQTGKIATDFPIDMKKFILSSLVLALPIFVLLNFIVVLTKAEVVALGLFLLFLSLMMYALELYDIYEKESLYTDKGIFRQTDSLKTIKNRLKGAGDFLPGALFLRIFGFFFRMNWIYKIIFIIGFIWCGIVHYRFLDIPIWPFITVLDICSLCSVGGQLMKFKQTKNYLAVILSTVALIISSIVLLLNPIQVLWYYCATGLSIISLAVNFIFIIKDYNRLAMRKLFQINSEGGSDFE